MSKILLLIAILMGVLVLPETFSLFAGQHNWYDTTQSGNQILCEKCHADIAAELSQPGKVNLIHKVMWCDQCHMAAAPNSEGLYRGPGGQFHAAATISCIDCHNNTLLYNTDFSNTVHSRVIRSGLGCMDCHKNPRSLPGSFSAVSIFTGPEEVHKDFANAAKGSNLLKDRNEACISCHTHVRVNISWTRPLAMAFSATVDNGTWSIRNFSGEGEYFIKTNG